MARYRTGHQDDELARELTQRLNMMMNAWHSGDSQVFKARFKEVDGWLRRYGFGDGWGKDFYAEAAAGRTGMAAKGVREGLQFISKAVDVARPIWKGRTFEQYVQEGEDYDAKCTELLMEGARELAKATGQNLSDCIETVAKASPELVECNARHSSRTSRAYWSACYGRDDA